MMKHVSLVAALSAALCIGLAPARADILSGRAQAHIGGAGGDGLGGARADNAFHEGASGVSYGFLVGAELFFLDGWIEHDQYHDGGGLVGTWTQFMLGIDLQTDLANKTRGGTYDEDGKLTGSDRYAPVYGEVGLAVGFGVGTGQQVDPPLDKSEVTDKGFLAQGHFGVGYRLTRFMSFGVMVPVQVGYMFKSGNGIAANDEGNHYTSMQGALLGFFRVDLKIK